MRGIHPARRVTRRACIERPTRGQESNFARSVFASLILVRCILAGPRTRIQRISPASYYPLSFTLTSHQVGPAMATPERSYGYPLKGYTNTDSATRRPKRIPSKNPRLCRPNVSTRTYRNESTLQGSSQMIHRQCDHTFTFNVYP